MARNKKTPLSAEHTFAEPYQPTPEEKSQKTKGSGWSIHHFPMIFIVPALALFLVASGTAFYFYRQAATLKGNPQKAVAEEAGKVIVAVGKLIVLPEGETPTVATVTDPERLKDQPFFAHATQGDKVLIYTNARKAILYNPGENKIVEVAPLNIGKQEP